MADKSYNTIVKENLIKWKESYEATNHTKLNYSSIAAAMIEHYGVDSASPSKIAEMFRYSEREVKLQEIVAIASMFDVPLNLFVDYPATMTTGKVDKQTLVGRQNAKNKTVIQFDNELYTGEYYCYYFRQRHNMDTLRSLEEAEIRESKLNISIENGRTVATLTEISTSDKFNGEKKQPLKFSGDLIYFTRTNYAYCFLVEENGLSAMALSFNYIQLNVDTRYFILAGMTSFCVGTEHHPVFEKMAIFRVAQNYQDGHIKEMLKGILSLDSTPIILDDDTLEELRSEDEITSMLLSEKNALTHCTVFLEQTLRGNMFKIKDDKNKTEFLLKTKAKSLLPARTVIFEDNHTVALVKKLQQQNLGII